MLSFTKSGSCLTGIQGVTYRFNSSFTCLFLPVQERVHACVRHRSIPIWRGLWLWAATTHMVLVMSAPRLAIPLTLASSSFIKSIEIIYVHEKQHYVGRVSSLCRMRLGEKNAGLITHCHSLCSENFSKAFHWEAFVGQIRVGPKIDQVNLWCLFKGRSWDWSEEGHWWQTRQLSQSQQLSFLVRR